LLYPDYFIFASEQFTAALAARNEHCAICRNCTHAGFTAVWLDWNSASNFGRHRDRLLFPTPLNPGEIMNVWWMIALSGMGTYLMRSAGVWVNPKLVQGRWLDHLPFAVILVITVQ
jgi:hypothetical protein